MSNLTQIFLIFATALMLVSILGCRSNSCKAVQNTNVYNSLEGLDRFETDELFYEVGEGIKNKQHTRNTLLTALGPPKDIIPTAGVESYPNKLYYIMKWSNKGGFMEVYFDLHERPYNFFIGSGY